MVTATFDPSWIDNERMLFTSFENFRFQVQMIKEIRNLEEALGNGIKKPTPTEILERVGARRSIYSAVKIHKGEKISPDMLKIVRHAYGLNPSELKKIIRKKARVDINENLPITWDKF